jgi:hypothetical protein
MEGNPSNNIPKKRTDNGGILIKTVTMAVVVKREGEERRLAYGAYISSHETLSSRIIPTEIADKMRGEIFTINHASQCVDSKCLLNIETTSKRMMETLTRDLNKIEEQGYMLRPNGRELQATLAEIRARKQGTTIMLNNRDQKIAKIEAVRLAVEATDKPNIDECILLKNLEWMLTGAKLNTLTQVTVYRMLCVLKGKKYTE